MIFNCGAASITSASILSESIEIIPLQDLIFLNNFLFRERSLAVVAYQNKTAGDLLLNRLGEGAGQENFGLGHETSQDTRCHHRQNIRILQSPFGSGLPGDLKIYILKIYW